MAATTGFITLPDNVRLAYTQTGPTSGPNIVFIPGWIQTAAQFHKQVTHFQTRFRVTTYDHRGHGDSDKPVFGYRVPRLAADLDALLEQLDLHAVTLVGHSMGASTIWAHWDLFPHTRVRKVVFIDQARSLTINPSWTAEERLLAGAAFTPEALFEMANKLAGPGGDEVRRGLAGRFYTENVDAAEFRWAEEQTAKAPARVAGAMMLGHALWDWGDVFPRFTVPVLVIAGKASIVPVESGQWIVDQVGPNARLVVFEKEEGGGHFTFVENPEKFNRVLEEFLDE
ncbi:alpha/beta-hydrolase [Annulohypoxylon maeteangense]|uniref:alpha/beta-hydrolase n=1 Tax=Annulohypoxylon maeteangense TaxID=1927788 RepID=UPI002008E422|nr:alpha/beta-hydrolase [Annulohypoxylon maeteangense]KAI0886018.1 alpha/beta-hydrolase [Annulohypoxylon maeteangense]